MDGFALDEFLSWTVSWFTSLDFSWTTSLTGTLIGIAGGMALLNIFARILNSSLGSFPSFASGFYGAGFFSA